MSLFSRCVSAGLAGAIALVSDHTPTRILAVAIVGVVYFQSGVDADQRKSIDDLHTQDKVITAQLQATSENLRVITVLLGRMDEQGTKHEMVAREKEMDRREAQGVRK